MSSTLVRTKSCRSTEGDTEGIEGRIWDEYNVYTLKKRLILPERNPR